MGDVTFHFDFEIGFFSLDGSDEFLFRLAVSAVNPIPGTIDFFNIKLDIDVNVFPVQVVGGESEIRASSRSERKETD